MAGSMEPFSARDELPRPIAPEPLWQESVVLIWWDATAGIGGFHRIGHEPGAGLATSWIGIHTRDGLRCGIATFELPGGERIRIDVRTPNLFQRTQP